MAEVLLEDAPRKARDLYEKGFAAMERGNLDYAMDMFTTALDLEPGLLHVRKFLRAAQIKKKGKGNKFSHSMSSLQGAGKMFGVSSALKKNPVLALKKAEELLRLDPLNPGFLKTFDQAAQAAGMPEAAILTYEAATEHSPNDAGLVERLGYLYLEMNETHHARQCFERLVQLRPKDQKALKALKDSTALDTMKSGGWEGADSYRDVMKDSKEATMLEQQGKASRSSSDIDDLLADAQAKVQREPENMNFKRGLADLYTRAHRYDEALRVLEEAVAASGGGDPEVERSVNETRSKQFDFNIENLRKAGDEQGAKDLEEEKTKFLFDNAQERVKKYPNDLEFKFELGVMLHERGDFTGAIQLFQASQRHPKRRIDSLYYLGRCFTHKGQHDIAAEQLAKAASEITVMDEMKKAILYELGQLHETMGKNAEATAFYKEVYSVDIGYRDVANKIENG